MAMQWARNKHQNFYADICWNVLWQPTSRWPHMHHSMSTQFVIQVYISQNVHLHLRQGASTPASTSKLLLVNMLTLHPRGMLKNTMQAHFQCLMHALLITHITSCGICFSASCRYTGSSHHCGLPTVKCGIKANNQRSSPHSIITNTEHHDKASLQAQQAGHVNHEPSIQRQPPPLWLPYYFTKHLNM